MAPRNNWYPTVGTVLLSSYFLSISQLRYFSVALSTSAPVVALSAI